MKIADRRGALEGAKRVVEERKLPHPRKQLILAYHEDAKGKPTTPAIIRTFWVSVGKKLCEWFDWDCEVQRYELEDGQLDFSRACITVQEEEFDVEGNSLGIHNLSHTVQRAPKFGGKTNFAAGIIAYSTKFANTPNAKRVRFNPMPGFVTKNRDGTRTVHPVHPMVIMWQQQADSEEATWIDGKKPSTKQMETLRAEWDNRGKKEAEKQAVGAATGPTDPSELDGEDFDNGIIT